MQSIQQNNTLRGPVLRALMVLCVLMSSSLLAQTSATFGDVVSLGGTPSDIVLDESRQLLYLVNAPASRIDVYDYLGQQLTGSIAVGQLPLSAAMSPDNAYLYVANHDSTSLSVITLGSGGLGQVTNTVALPAKPQGVAVGFDGKVVISTDGSGTTSTSNTLLVYDATQGTGSQLLAVLFPPAPATPPSLTAPTATRTTTQFNAKLQATADGKFIIGVSSITNNTSTVVFLYEVASETILLSRQVTGQSSTLAIAPDGASFMAGSTLYDTATLGVIGQQNTSNAPFQFSSATATFQTNFNVGGSIFSPSGTVLYSAFNVAALTNPAPSAQASTLLLSDPRSLGIQLGINLPESILSRFVITADGSQAWALSTSGFIHLPIGNLYTYPILMPDKNVVFLPQDPCNAGVVQTSVKINNIGGGNLTFAVPGLVTGTGGSVVVTASSGVAPGTLTFTLDPGRSGVVRTPGTNMFVVTGANAATNTGTAINVVLASNNAINVPPVIRVYMNYRDSTMSGVIYPVATVPNSANGVANNQACIATATLPCYEGLQDIVLDEPRAKVYISNSGYNRIEVFDTKNLVFQTPIPVGQLPHQMAMSLDGSQLYVANTGGESISIVDLDQQQVTGSIQFPPIPRAGNAKVNTVAGMAMGLSGLQIVLRDGTLWTVVGNQAVPRVGTSVTGVNTNGTQVAITATPNLPAMVGSQDGTSVVLLSANGTAYLYDGLADSYTSSNRLFSGTINGYFGVLGAAPSASFLLANSLVTNRSLSPIGGYTSVGSAVLLPPTGPGGPGGIGISTTGARNVAAVAPVGSNAFVRMTTAVRTNLTAATSDDVHTTLEAVSVTTGAAAIAARMPENPVLPEFALTRIQMPPRQMVVDSAGTVYALTLSGLSVVPLTPATSATQPQIAASGGVVNAISPTSAIKPGSFITIKGTSLASAATASTLPPPTLLGGSCVLVGDVAIPLLSTAPNQISAQIPAVGSSRVDLQACKLEYSIVSPK